MELYVYLNGARRGPFSEKNLQAQIEAGLLRPLDLASVGPEGNLQPLAELVRQPVTDAMEASASAPPIPAPQPSAVNESAPPSTIKLGPYARATLAPNETPVHRTSLHWIIFARFGLAALATFLFLAIPFAIAVQAVTSSQLGWFVLPLPAFLLIAPTLAYISSELVITNIRVLIKSGIIRRQTLEMFIHKIESIAIDQGFFGRMLDYGTVVVRGTGGFEERFEAIARPLEFRKWVQRMQRGSETVASAGSSSPTK